MELSNAYNKALELEGLLLLLKSENTDNFKIDLIFTRLYEKIDEICADLDTMHRQFQIELYHAAQQPLKDNSQSINDSNDSKQANSQADEQKANDGNAEIEKECQDDSAIINDYESAQMNYNVDNVAASDNCNEPLAADDSVEPTAQADEVIATDDILPQPVEDLTATNLDANNSTKIDIEVANVADIVADTQNAAIDSPINIELDENNCIDVNQSAFARSARGDIRKMFTLNDNYKFRRQLFDNSQQQYADTLSKIELMNSMADAESYIYDTMGLDRDNADVKDFMTIVTAYFMGK